MTSRRSASSRTRFFMRAVDFDTVRQTKSGQELLIPAVRIVF